MAAPKIRARYKVVGPKLVKREVTKARMNPKLKALETKKEIVEEKMWMVFFPQGHSIRVNEQELKAQGLHLKPRLVDMNTGDVLDAGGDPYDLSQDIEDFDVTLADDDDDDIDVRTTRPSRSKTAEA